MNHDFRRSTDPSTDEGFSEHPDGMNAEPISRLSSVLPSGMILRARALGLRGHWRRLMLVTGPGDVAGSHAHWQAGRNDPSIPSIAYSSQIYELSEALGAELTVLHETPATGVDPARGRIRFRETPPPKGTGIGFHLADIAHALGIVARAAVSRSDLIILQRGAVHFWPYALARLFGCRVMVSMHNTLWPAHRRQTRRERLINRLNGWFFRRTDGVVAVSDAARRQAISVAGPGHNGAIQQIPQYQSNLVHAWRPRPADRALEQLLYLGRIEEDKGVFDLLDAFAMVAPAQPEMHLRIVGTGSDLARLRGAAGALPHSIARRIEIPGPVSGAEVFDELADADLLVCPTTGQFAEGLAKTPIEAAIMGVPSLITSVVPVSELLGDAAVVVPADNVSAMAMVMTRLAQNPARLADMAEATAPCRDRLFDRGCSLASQLLVLMERAAERHPLPARTAPGVTGVSVPGSGLRAGTGLVRRAFPRMQRSGD